MTQAQQILQHIRDRGSITALDALNLYGCFRLAARINDLRRDGHEIITHTESTSIGKSIARYSFQQERAA